MRLDRPLWSTCSLIAVLVSRIALDILTCSTRLSSDVRLAAQLTVDVLLLGHVVRSLRIWEGKRVRLILTRSLIKLLIYGLRDWLGQALVDSWSLDIAVKSVCI